MLGNERQGCNPANSGFYSESRDTKLRALFNNRKSHISSLIYFAFLRNDLLGNHLYRAGSTSNVRIVEDIIPPITTVARGL